VDRITALNKLAVAKKKYVGLLQLKLKQMLLNEHPTLYNAMFRHISTRMKKMRFDTYPYLIDIYIDNARRKCIKSSVQSGKTEFMVIDHLAKAERGLAVMYVLPNDLLRNRFVKNRIEKMFNFVPYYMDKLLHSTGTSKSMGLKHYGKGTIVYAGSGSETSFKEIPADAIYADELDQFNFRNYAMAFDRLSSSEWKIVVESANPTVSEYGIDEAYQRSDKKTWQVKCQACNTWQKMDFFQGVVCQTEDGNHMLLDQGWKDGCGRDIHIFCVKCGKALNRLSQKGAWVEEHPGKEIRGYQISKLFSPHNTIQEVWESFVLAQKNQVKLQVFYNSDLGECFEAKGSKLTTEILNRCKGNYSMPDSCGEPCAMGIDVGSLLHVVINRIWSDTEQLVWAGTVREFEDLDELITRFTVKSFVVDAMPETRASTKLCERHRYIARMCRYLENKIEDAALMKDSFEIRADRTQSMDAVLSGFLNREFMLPSNADTILDGSFYRQLCKPVRMFVDDKDKGEGRFIFTKGEDHFFHTYVYARLARRNMRDFKMRSISLNPTVNDSNRTAIGENNIVIPAGTPPSLRRFWEKQLEKNKKRERKSEK